MALPLELYAVIALVGLGGVSLVLAFVAERQQRHAVEFLEEARRRPYVGGGNQRYESLTFSLLTRGSRSAGSARVLASLLTDIRSVALMRVLIEASAVAGGFLLFILWGVTGYAFVIGFFGFLLILRRLNLWEAHSFLSAILKAGVEELSTRDESHLGEVVASLRGNVRYYLVLSAVFLGGSLIILLFMWRVVVFAFAL